MKDKWEYFVAFLPSKMENHVLNHVGNITDFQLNDSLNADENTLLFISPSTQIKIHFFRNLFATSISIWYPDAEKNNRKGDPSFTDNRFCIESPFAALKSISREGEA